MRKCSDISHKPRTHAGAEVWPSCTLAYAPPETVAAVHTGSHVRAAASQDVWALGVLGYEAMTQTRSDSDRACDRRPGV